MESLPAEVFMLILASCTLKTLVESVPLVCKKRRDTIFSSKYFQCLHYRVSEPKKCLLILGTGYTDVQDKGLVCRSTYVDDEECPLEVRNLVTNLGKIIPSPSPGFYPVDMTVDANSGYYTILATKVEDFIMPTEVFDSRENVWKKAATLCWGDPLQNKLVGSFAMLDSRTDLVAAYDMKQNSWSMAKLEIPDSAGFSHSVLSCKDKIMLASLAYEPPHLKLWDLIVEDGVAKPRYMTEIKGAALAQLMRSHDARTDLTKWRPMFAQTGDDTIEIVVNGGEMGTRCILLVYDILRCFWRVVIIPVKTSMAAPEFFSLFTPSLFSA